MRKFSYLAGCVCLVLSLFACKEDEPIDAPVKGASGRTVLTASVEVLNLSQAPPLKNDDLSLQSSDNQIDGADKNVKIWTKADKLGVFGSESGINAKYTLYNESEGEVSGKFYGPEITGEIYAYYPYSEDISIDGSKIVLSFPTEQIYDSDISVQFPNNTNYLIAKGDDSGVLEFLHPLGCLGIGIKGGIAVKSIALSSASKPLAGAVAIDYADNFAVSSVTGSSRNVKLSLDSPVMVDMDEPTVFWVMLPPSVYDDLVVSVETADGTFSKFLAGEFDVRRISLLDSDCAVGNTTVVAQFDALELDGRTDVARTWERDAVFGLFSADAVNSRYTIAAADAGKSSASFAGVETDGESVAYYPYTPNAVMKETQLVLPVSSTQTYCPDLLEHFRRNTPFTVAKAAVGETFVFKYLSGVVGIKVKADCTVKNIVLTRKSGGISGNFAVDTENDFAMSPANGSRNTITLNCGEGAETTVADPTTFYVLLPPAVYDDISVKVTTANGDTLFATLDRALSVERLSVADLGKDVSYITVTVDIDASAAANEGGKCKWADEDEIIVYDALSGSVKKGTLLSGEGTTQGVFKIANSTENDVYEWMAYAPSVSLVGDALAFDSKYSVAMTGQDRAYGAGNTPLFARNNGNGFRAKSMMGCIAVKVKGNVTVTGITVKNGSVNIASDNKVQVALATADSATPTTTLVSNSFQATYINMSSADGVPVSSDDYTTFYVNVPAGITWNALQVGIATAEGSFVKTAGACTIDANAAPVTVAEVDFDALKSSASSAADLSADGHYANCYIVEPAGTTRYYSFDAKHVDGTAVSNSGLKSDKLTYAQMLWATTYDLVYDLWFDTVAGKIFFRYDGDVKGNVKIAITDPQYNVGWTYHIWCTDRPCDAHIVGRISDSTGAMADYYWMDRNLGATYAPHTKSECLNISFEDAAAACGLMFQFGNMNSIPGAEGINAGLKNESTAFANRKNFIVYGFSQYVQGSFKASDAIKSSADIAMSFPNYIYGKTVDGRSKWLSTAIECNGKKYTDPNCLWWYVEDEPLKNKLKGKYDPCPYGYITPSQSAIYRGLQKSYAEAGQSMPTIMWTGVYNSADDACYGAYTEDADGGFMWLPMSGYGLSKVANVGGSGYWWVVRNGSGDPTTDIPAYARMPAVKGEGKMSVAWGTINNTTTQSRVPPASGYALRCIRHIAE